MGTVVSFSVSDLFALRSTNEPWPRDRGGAAAYTAAIFPGVEPPPHELGERAIGAPVFSVDHT